MNARQVSGTDLDHNEREMLARLADRASDCYAEFENEALRARINDDDGSPWIDLMPSTEATVEIVDLQKLPDATAAAVHVAEQWKRKPFDLQRGPLARFLIIRLASDSHTVGMGAHHMMVDGWSLAIAWGEICKIYNARVVGQTANLPPLAIQYIDYAAWEREELHAGLCYLSAFVGENNMAFSGQRVGDRNAKTPGQMIVAGAGQPQRIVAR
jgi:hypothetical protein